MSFDSLEESVDQGQPIHYYEFVVGGNYMRYTTAAKTEMTPDGKVWKPCAISDDGIKYSGESTTDQLNIRLPSGEAIAQLFMQSLPSEAVLVRIAHRNIGDDERQIKYTGEISQHDMTMAGVCRLTCETLSASMQRTGLRLGWQKTCPYALYDQATCKLPMEPLGVDIIVISVDGFDVQTDSLGGFPDGRFSGGFVRWDGGVRGMLFQQIEHHSGFTIRMFGATNPLTPGMRLKAFPGCARTVDACTALGNYSNYGGIPNLPGRSPFDGMPVFY